LSNQIVVRNKCDHLNPLYIEEIGEKTEEKKYHFDI